MARHDYICCKSCGCKFVYDGYYNIRDGLEAQYGTMDLICPDCLKELETKLAEREQEPAQAVPVAEVVWYDPRLTHPGSKRAPHKIIDASLTFFDEAPVGTKLYTAPPTIDDETRKMVLYLCSWLETTNAFIPLPFYNRITTTVKKLKEKLGAE